MPAASLGARFVGAALGGGVAVGVARLARSAMRVGARRHRREIGSWSEERARASCSPPSATTCARRSPRCSLLATAIDDEVVEDAKRREYAARMNTHVRALGALIDDLFDLTRLEAKELAWTMERVRARRARARRGGGDAAVRRRRRRRRARRAGSPLTPSQGNHEQLQRVLFNLIQNAIHHTPPDGSVTVRAQDVDGGGRDRGRRHRPGHRAPTSASGSSSRSSAATRRAPTPGAGLGLAISRAIVEAHGGRIWLEDADVGTRVRFRLPVSI